MSSSPLPKHPGYYESDRRDFLEWVGGRHARILDIGCGAGTSAGWYRDHGAVHLTGIEIDGDAADRAARAFEHVVHGSVEDALAQGAVGGGFDLIVCADVLEHLVDPWSVLRSLRSAAAPEGVLAVSVPNIRYLRALARIAVGKGFAYEDHGIFDSTHVRFFTPGDLVRLLESAGWEVRRRGAPRGGRLRAVRAWGGRLTSGRTDQWLAMQAYALAVPCRTAAAPQDVSGRPAGDGEG